MKRTLQQIKQDIRSCYDSVAIGYQLKDQEIIDHYTREAKALERELELRKTGHVLTGV